MVDRFRRMIEHMRWADERVLESLRGAVEPPAQALEIYAHVLGAEHVWLSRLRQQPATVAVWPTLDLDECGALGRETIAGLSRFLDPLVDADLERRIPYRNSAGDAFESSIAEILTHLALHGTYHRGQVALLLRHAGAEPAPTDYIAFARGAAAATRRG